MYLRNIYVDSKIYQFIKEIYQNNYFETYTLKISVQV